MKRMILPLTVVFAAAGTQMPAGWPATQQRTTIRDYIAGYIMRPVGSSFTPVAFLASGTTLGLGVDGFGLEADCPKPNWLVFSDGPTNATWGTVGWSSPVKNTTMDAGTCLSSEGYGQVGSMVCIPGASSTAFQTDGYIEKQPSGSVITTNATLSAYVGANSGVNIFLKTNAGNVVGQCDGGLCWVYSGAIDAGAAWTHMRIGCQVADGFNLPCGEQCFCVSDTQINQGNGRSAYVRDRNGAAGELPNPRVLLSGTPALPLVGNRNGSLAYCMRGGLTKASSITPGDAILYPSEAARVGKITGTDTYALLSEGAVSTGISCTDTGNTTFWNGLADGGASSPTLVARNASLDPYGASTGDEWSFPATTGIESSIAFWTNSNNSCPAGYGSGGGQPRCLFSAYVRSADGGSGTIDLFVQRSDGTFATYPCNYTATMDRCWASDYPTGFVFGAWGFGNASRFADGGTRPQQSVIIAWPMTETALGANSTPSSFVDNMACSGAGTTRQPDNFGISFDGGVRIIDGGCLAVSMVSASPASGQESFVMSSFAGGGPEADRTPMNRSISGTTLQLTFNTDTSSTCTTDACFAVNTPARFVSRWGPGGQSIRSGQTMADGGFTGLNVTSLQQMLTIGAPRSALFYNFQVSDDPTACVY